jgi:hypothetical protein
MAGSALQDSFPFANAVSADPMMEDDAELERLMLGALEGGLLNGPLPHTWKLAVPRHLQGSGVLPRYNCVTFRRSIAVQHPAADVDFVHRLHPLFRAVSEHALAELTLAPARNGTAPRIAVRRHELATQRPFAVFTYLELQAEGTGRVFGIAVDADARRLDQSAAETMLAADAATPGEVPWQQCEQTFSRCFADLQQAAARAARDLLSTQADIARRQRMQAADVMREEADLYRIDRLAEIDDDERTERAGPADQVPLFRETVTPWKARRAAVETHYGRRLDEVSRYAQVPEPVDPQALGVLLVFPPT